MGDDPRRVKYCGDADVIGHHTIRDARSSMRVLVVLNTGGAWQRGILRGFMAVALEHDWTLLHYRPGVDLNWLAEKWAPHAAVIGSELREESLEHLTRTALVSVTVDRSAAGIASVCPEEEAIGTMALRHLLDTGLRRFSTFRLEEFPFAVARERAFVEGARAVGAQVAVGWGNAGARPEQRLEDPTAIVEWLRQLPRPCGIFTCTDGWARTVGRYVQAAGLRVPEDIALVGADNDILECELASPPLSSVVIPWRELGKSAAQLVQLALAGKPIEGKRLTLPPIGVVARRSSSVFAISDPLVARAVRWIRSNAERRLTVKMVAQAVGGGRKRLERRFRAALNRTVHDEIRRAHVEMAKALLEAEDVSLVAVARRSGFTNAALLTDAFHHEIGMPPGVYRRRLRQELGHPATVGRHLDAPARSEPSKTLVAGGAAHPGISGHTPPRFR